jgi:adenylate kinase family enzyme
MGIRIHTVGASGSGTTTLAKALSSKLGLPHFDSDDYYWEKTNPPYTTKRTIQDRLRLLTEDLGKSDSWILSGSLVSWGEPLMSQFTQVVFLYIPQDVRIGRILEREKSRHGSRIEAGGDMYQQHLEFIEWAKKYDTGGFEVRSKVMHEAWLQKLSCPVIRLEKPFRLEESVSTVLQSL